MEAINPPAHRGFRNKGKVAAGRQHPGTAPTPAASKNQVPKQHVRKRVRKQKRRDTGDVARSFPAAVGRGLRGRVSKQPHLASSGRCRALITDLAASSSAGVFATILDMPINPGNSRMFPRLSALSDVYEEYCFKYLRFIYRPTCNVNTAGSIGFYIDYDPVDAAASNMGMVMANLTAWTGAPYLPNSITADPASRSRWYYTFQQTTNTSGPLDRQQDLGDFRFVVDKLPSNQGLGYLEVEYECVFRRPKEPAALVFAGNVKPGGQVTSGEVSFIMTDVLLRGFNQVENAQADDETDLGGYVQYCPNIAAQTTFQVTLKFIFDVNFGANTVTVKLQCIRGGAVIAPLASQTGTGAVAFIQYSTVVQVLPGDRLFFTAVSTAGTYVTQVGSYVALGTALTMNNVGAVAQPRLVATPSKQYVLPDMLATLQTDAASLSGVYSLQDVTHELPPPQLSPSDLRALVALARQQEYVMADPPERRVVEPPSPTPSRASQRRAGARPPADR